MLLERVTSRLRATGERSTGPPDYVGVGALGSGAGWWHDLLLQHPAVERRGRDERELHFFDQFCTRGMSDADVAAYHARFPRTPGRIGGEWTPRYMYDPWTPLLLRRAAPAAKLLVMVSDPIELYRSRFALCRPDSAGRGRYATQLRALAAYYEPDRILVLQYERCRLDPLGQYARTVRFLGLADDFRPRLDGFRGRGRGLGPRRVIERVKRKLLSSGPADAIDIWPDLERSLRVALEPEVLDLREMVRDLDLSLWPGFADLAVR